MSAAECGLMLKGELEASREGAKEAKFSSEPVSWAEIQEARNRLLDLAAATAAAERPMALPKAVRRQECPQCRGNNYVWLVNVRTLQREIGDCPSCGAKRPELPAGSHKETHKHFRTGHNQRKRVAVEQQTKGQI